MRCHWRYGRSPVCRGHNCSQQDWHGIAAPVSCLEPPRIIATHRAKLAADFGVKSLALFGSVVRDEATDASDVDFLVEFDGRPIGLFHLSRTQHYLETILGVPRVDLVMRDGIKPALRERILREAIHAA